jgi:signal transduction histidine kinase
LREYQDTLEGRIKERTKAINESNKELEQYRTEIGLSTAQKIVVEQGGEIWAES